MAAARTPTKPAPAPEPARVDVIASAAGAIEHSRWSGRLWYMNWTTAALLLILAVAVYLQNHHAITVVAGLVTLNAILMVVTPSAEQITKMLAQVAAIRFGVGSPPKDTPTP